MALEQSHASSDVNSVSPANFLLGLIQRIQKSGKDTSVMVSDNGKITIFPGRNEYHASVPDMAGFCQTPADQLKMQDASGADSASTAEGRRPLRDLLWQAAFHISAKGLIEDASLYQIAKFSQWPNMTRLPVTPNTARICALLTRQSYTVMLVPRILGVSKDEVCQVYSAAYASGIVQVVHDIGKLNASSQEAESIPDVPEDTPKSGLFRSLFSKIAGL